VNNLTGDEIRSHFLSFFEEKGHKVLPSSSLIPHGDPTLLLTTAGMVQFKPYFMGEAKPPHARLTTVQKCFRTTDIESVGDSSHLTFFEMLGNFSVGDYFKAEAITWAWELITQRFKIPASRLWTTVYLDDDEAIALWRNMGVPAERIVRLGEADNFWGPAGETGPCGPCSEIHYDFGVETGCGKRDCNPACKCGRFCEIWNLVFMQYYQDKNGKHTPLPKPNIDTGMGLERITAIMQGKSSVYQTDIFQPLLARIAELCGKTYGQDEKIDRALRTVVEHSRGIAFLIADGVMPSNEKRGYVLRRLLRRAQYFSEILVRDKMLLVDLAEMVISNMGNIYPELLRNRSLILMLIKSELEKSQEALRIGSGILNSTLFQLREELGSCFCDFEVAFNLALSNQRIEGSNSLSSGLRDAIIDFRRCPAWEHVLIIARRDIVSESLKSVEEGLKELERTLLAYKGDHPHAFRGLKESLQQIFEIKLKVHVKVVTEGIFGHEAFILYDTYGLPIELTQEIAHSRGLAVDIRGFESEMEKQREKARASHKFDVTINVPPASLTIKAFAPTVFVGHASLSQSTRIVGIIVANEGVNDIITGQKAGLVLENTPFYAEMGGQVGDTGQIKSSGGLFIVTNSIKFNAYTTLHQGYLASGSLTVGDEVTAEVDTERRADIARNHTATHLLHYALRQLLGEHVQQRGSLVAPERLRFDFSHLSALTPEQIAGVQQIVNREIRANHPVYDKQLSYKEAMATGAIALFDEKYGDTVRVLSVGNPAVSMELCGGTHVSATGEIGMLQIITESSIGAGLRRVEAVTGREAERLVAADFNTLQSLAKLLEASPDGVLDKVKAVIQGRDEQIKRSEALERELALKEVASLLSQVFEIDGIKLLATRIKPSRPEILRDMADALRDKLGSAVVVLGTVHEDKPYFVVTVTPDLVAKNYHAGNIIRQVAAITGGGGGGKPGLAQGGGKDVSRLDEAIAAVAGLMKKK
jgi:alanyl-tRNA synthetase